MPFDVRATITGIQEAQAANLRLIAAARPEGGLGRAVQYAATAVHRYAVMITHVITGALRASHRIRLAGAARAEIYLDPTATNPRTGERTAEYGPAEHARGGSHAFYERPVSEQGDEIAARAALFL